MTPTSKSYSVPRRFDLITIFVVISAFALLFAAMRALHFSAGTFAFVVGLIVVVVIAQAMIPFAPRSASILAGAAYCFVLVFDAAIANPMVVILGYVVGTLIGAIFLIADRVRQFLAKREPLGGSNRDD